jgi:hypothetical protein
VASRTSPYNQSKSAQGCAIAASDEKSDKDDDPNTDMLALSSAVMRDAAVKHQRRSPACTAA